MTFLPPKKFWRFWNASRANRFSDHRAFLKAPKPAPSEANRSGARPAYEAALIRFHHASRIPGNDEFARGTLQSVRSGGAPDREGLNVPVLAAIGVGGRAELDLEGDVFAMIAIRVEAKGVETFVAEGVGRADAGVRIHGQSHHRCARAAAKQVEVADVDAGVFFCGRRIEMMRHGESSPKGLDARPKGRSLGQRNSFSLMLCHACLLKQFHFTLLRPQI